MDLNYRDDREDSVIPPQRHRDAEKKLLIYRRGGLGDILGLRPLLVTAKAAGWKIHGAGDPERWALLPEGLVDQVHWPEKLLGKGFLADPKPETAPELPYDKILFFSSCRPAQAWKWAFVPALPPRGENLYAHSERIGAEALGLPPKRKPPLTPALSPRERKILVAPGAGSERKRWPLDKFLTLAEKLVPRPSFLLGPAEPAAWEGLIETRGFAILKPEISGLRKAIQGFSHFIGNDSGPAHLAAQEGLATLILYGPTDPALWAPPGNITVIQAPEGRLELVDPRKVGEILG